MIDDVNISKIIVSKKAAKFLNIFLVTKIKLKIKLSCTMLPKMNAYRRNFDETNYMSFLIRNAELLESYNKTWEKASNSVEKRFDTELVQNEKYLKNKIKSND